MKKLKQNYIYYLSFGIPVFLMLLIFVVRRIFPFGDRSFLHLDMYHQYFPFLNEFFHKLRNGDSLLYSFHTGIGSNFLALYVYYLASPLNWLAVLCPEKYLIEFMTYLIVFRIGMCGFTFSYYLSKHFNTKSFSIILFSVFYALSGYMAAYNWNVMWLDCIVLAPLIILGLERLVNEKKPILYCISLAVAILSNYYLCIMICIFLVLYFVILLLSCEHKLQACFRFALYSLLAGGMAAVLLLPELEILQLTEFSNTPFPSMVSTYFPLFDVISRHFVDVTVEKKLAHWPNLYCGVSVMIFLPLYVMNRKICFREKMGKLILLAFLLISFTTNTLNFIWHGFNYPDSLPCRQSFLYIFLLLTVCFETFLHIREYSKTKITSVYCGVLFFVLLSEKLVTDQAFSTQTFLLTAIILVLYGIFINLYLNYPGFTKRIAIYAILIVASEAFINTYFTSVPTVSRSDYLKNYDDYHTLTSRCLTTDSEFYRFEKFKRNSQNDGTLSGYASGSFFSSTVTASLTGFYDKYGLKNSRVFYSFDGSTPLTSALLDVHYMISSTKLLEDPLYTLVDTEKDLFLYKNNYTLPLGYTVKSSTIEKETDDKAGLNSILNPILLQNNFASRYCPDQPLFESLSVKNAQSENATLELKRTSHLYAYVENEAVTACTVSIDGEEQTFKKLNPNPYILDLGYQKNGTIIKFSSDDKEPLNLVAYSLNEDVLKDLIEILSTDSLIVDSYHSTKISGHIDVSDSSELVLSIPFEPGWSVYIDGVKTEVRLFENCMLRVPVDKGSHTVTISFYPKALNIGIAISLLSLCVFLLICFIPSIKARRSREAEKLPLCADQEM